MQKRTTSQLKKELDLVFGRYIKKRDSFADYAFCISCNNVIPVKSAQCGHYHSRNILTLRYDEYNCNIQCKTCNETKAGNLKEYKKGLIKKYGEWVLGYLKDKKNNHRNILNWDYQELLKIYKVKEKEYEYNRGSR